MRTFRLVPLVLLTAGTALAQNPPAPPANKPAPPAAQPAPKPAKGKKDAAKPAAANGKKGAAEPAPANPTPDKAAPPATPSAAPAPAPASAPAPAVAAEETPAAAAQPAPTGAAQPAPEPPAPAAAAPAPGPSAPAPAAPAKADEGGHFKIYGKLYADFSYAVNQDLGANTHDKTTAFDMKRFYLGINYTLTKIFSAKFQTDIGDHNKHYDVFVKAAYFQAKFAPEFTVRAGVGDNPWIPYAEHRYGYRYVENTLIDRLHYGNSADWGVHVLGDIAKGMLGYQVSVVNGNGYANPARAHVPTGAARLNTQPIKHLNIAVGTSVSTLGAPGPVACPQSKCPGYGTRFDGLIAWDSDPFRVGVEGFLGKNYTADQISGKAPEDTARGVSGFANVRFIPMLGMFGRFDYAQPAPNTDSGVKDMYFNVGLDASATKFLELALVYKWETVKSGDAGAVLNKVGSTVPNSKGRRQEIGIFSQLKF